MTWAGVEHTQPRTERRSATRKQRAPNEPAKQTRRSINADLDAVPWGLPWSHCRGGNCLFVAATPRSSFGGASPAWARVQPLASVAWVDHGRPEHHILPPPIPLSWPKDCCAPRTSYPKGNDAARRSECFIASLKERRKEDRRSALVAPCRTPSIARRLGSAERVAWSCRSSFCARKRCFPSTMVQQRRSTLVWPYRTNSAAMDPYCGQYNGTS